MDEMCAIHDYYLSVAIRISVRAWNVCACMHAGISVDSSQHVFI